jgi:hypothetical protein
LGSLEEIPEIRPGGGGEEKEESVTFLQSKIDWCVQRIIPLEARSDANPAMVAEGWEAPPHNHPGAYVE